MFVVLLLWRERDERGATYDYVRPYEFETAPDADAKFAELSDLIVRENWRPNLRAFDIALDRMERRYAAA
jgi:hypothetical protein